MNPDVKKRLDRLILKQRLKYGFVAILIIIAVSSFLLFVGYEQTIHIDKVVATTTLGGSVTQVKRGAGRKSGFKVKVKLDDGRQVNAVSFLARVPFRGERLSVNEIAHKSGRKNFVVTRFAAPHK